MEMGKILTSNGRIVPEEGAEMRDKARKASIDEVQTKASGWVFPQARGGGNGAGAAMPMMGNPQPAVFGAAYESGFAAGMEAGYRAGYREGFVDGFKSGEENKQ